jgi:hypothetical protein
VMLPWTATGALLPLRVNLLLSSTSQSLLHLVVQIPPAQSSISISRDGDFCAASSSTDALKHTNLPTSVSPLPDGLAIVVEKQLEHLDVILAQSQCHLSRGRPMHTVRMSLYES